MDSRWRPAVAVFAVIACLTVLSTWAQRTGAYDPSLRGTASELLSASSTWHKASTHEPDAVRAIIQSTYALAYLQAASLIVSPAVFEKLSSNDTRAAEKEIKDYQLQLVDAITRHAAYSDPPGSESSPYTPTAAATAEGQT